MEKKQKLYRIAELERLSGLPRRTIHFYIQSGLLHSPIRTGKTMAYYDDGHLQKLKLIQKEKASGAPLFAIKRDLEENEGFRDIKGEHSFSFNFKLGQPANRRRRKTGPRKKHANRENIIQQGCMLFRERGYMQTKVSDITKALNIGKGTFYFYFSDKRELLLECVPMIFQDLFSQGFEKIRKEKDPLKRMDLRAQAVFPVLPEFCAIVQLCKEAMADTDRKLKRMGRETFLTIRKPLESDIEKGIENGSIRPVDPKIIGTILIGLIESMFYLKDLDASITQDSVWNTIVSMLMSGIKKQ